MMSDPQHQTTETPLPPPHDGAANDDPLAHLHRMSRTAGLGTQDYVAINTLAVAALLLGLAGALAMVSGALLLIPLAGVVCAVIALWQISDSNGTQAGKGLAIGGLILSLAFVGLVGSRQLLENYRTRADRQAVIDTVEEFGQRLQARDIDGAYGMMGERFRERVNKSEFETDLNLRFNHAMHGKVQDMRSNGKVVFDADPQTGVQFASTLAIIDLEHRPQDRPQMALQKVDNRWVIEAFGWFPPRPAQPQQAGN